MPDSVELATLEILKRIQADVASLRRMETDVADIKARLERVETRIISTDGILRKMRRDNAGVLVLMRTAAGSFEERVSDLESMGLTWVPAFAGITEVTEYHMNDPER